MTFGIELSLPYSHQNIYDHLDLLKVEVEKVINCILSNEGIKIAHLQFICMYKM